MFSDYEFEYIDACPVCGATEEQWGEETGEGVSQGLWIIYRHCNNCDVAFQNPRLTTAEALRAYVEPDYRQTVSGNFGAPTDGEVDLQAMRAGRIVSVVKAYGWEVTRHLDIGTSLGILPLQMKKEFGCEGWGVEPSLLYRAAANAHDGAITVVESLDEIEGKFDLITAVHMFEHLNEPIEFLRRIKELQAPGGHTILETPDGAKTSGMSVWHPMIYTQPTIAKTMEYGGFKKEQVEVKGLQKQFPDKPPQQIPGMLTIITH